MELVNVPGLLSRFGKVPLGNFPTPLRYIEIDSKRGFWIKDEGCSHRSYGGNKVRKLEYLFNWVKRNNRHKLIVWGDTKSHTVEAVAILGRKCGFHVDAVMYCMPGLHNEFNAERNLIQRQINVSITSNMLSAYLLARFKSINSKSAYIPLGATTSYSTLGHVAAASEFVDQWKSTNMRWPKAIYLAMGSGGTVSGLAVGLALMGIPVKLNAVQTVNTSITNAHTMRKQIAGVLRLLDLDAKLAKSILSTYVEIDSRYLGKGYGDLTGASLSAVSRARFFGVNLEPVHTGKVMAAVLDDIAPENDPAILYWHTHSDVGYTPRSLA